MNNNFSPALLERRKERISKKIILKEKKENYFKEKIFRESTIRYLQTNKNSLPAVSRREREREF